ncbi:MAG: iron-containing redox enzyme family protein [Gemmatimonadales bacterium]
MSALGLEPHARGRCITLPEARGPIGARLFAALEEPPGTCVDLAGIDMPGSPLSDDDLQLALYVLYELHYATVAGVDERWEWNPGLLAVRAELEQVFEQALDEAAGEPERDEPDEVGAELQRLVGEDDGPSLSRYLEVRGTIEQMLEHVIHRSAYQLKEADPHSWAIPRLAGAAKAALLEIQFDEYGEGRAERMHSTLFAATMAGLGLDPSYGAYLAALPGITLATVNAMSCFGLHRRRRGALVGHLAAFEMSSSIPNRRYGNALRRLGFGPEVTTFYDEHVEADAVHESIAAWDLAGGLARSEPELARDIQMGARSLLALEAMWAQHLLSCWERGDTSLRPG